MSLLLFGSATARAVTPTDSSMCAAHAVNSTYLTGTLQSLEKMRGENGLLNDTTLISQYKIGAHAVDAVNKFTSPTNMAVDLLIQVELARNPDPEATALKKLARSLATLARLPFHVSSGLFHSWYSTAQSSDVRNYDVSSIDNLHLAIALWTVSQTFPNSPTAEVAQKLFQRMDFSAFYDEAAGLIGGNLRYENGKWTREKYNFANLGSEARILYSAGWALGLFRNVKDDLIFVSRVFNTIRAEVFHSPEGDILKLWDGAAFQLYFPKIFVSEENYSPKIAGYYTAMAKYMIAEGARRGLTAPAAHSAVRVSVIDLPGEPAYRDKSGNRDLVSSDNLDLLQTHLERNWESTFSPYALFMAATASPEEIIPLFSQLQTVESGGIRMYLPELGWMEALHVAGARAGEVIPVQLALNQGMIALSLLQILAPDGMSPSGRAMHANPAVRARLQQFYDLFDEQIQ